MSNAYYALIIQGIGDTAELSYAYEFYIGDVSLGGSGPKIQALIDEDFDELGTKIDPLTSGVEIGAMTFSVPMDLFPQSEIVGIDNDLDVGAIMSRRIKEADGLLAADLTKVATTVTLYSRSGSNFSAGDIIYISWEAISLTSLDSSSVPNSTQTFTCVRGVWGTDAREHKTRPGTGDIPTALANYDYRVYFNPKMRGRRCHIVVHDGTTLNTVQHGVITNIQPTDNMAVAEVTVEAVFSMLVDREQNRLPIGGRPDPAVALSYGDGPNPQGLSVHQFIGTIPGNAKTRTYGRYTGDDDHVIIQVGETLAACKYDATNNRYDFTPEVGVTFPGILLDSPPPKLEGRLSDIASPEFANEVLVFGDVKDAEGNQYGATFEHTGTNQENLHALTALLHILLSSGRGDNFSGAASNSYDRLGPTLGNNMPHEVIDVAGIETLRSDYLDDAISVAVFGYDGKPFKLADVKAKLATPWMYYMHPTIEGKLTFSKLEVIAPGQGNFTSIDASEIEVLSEGMNFNWDAVQNSIAGTYGLPWQREAQISQFDHSRGLDPWDPVPKEVERKLKLHAVSQNQYELEDILRDYLAWVTKPLPTYKFRLTAPSSRIFAGQRIGLNIGFLITSQTPEYEGAFRDADGALITGSPATTIYGIVTECSYDFARNVYDISLWGVNDRLVATPKVIAPAFKVFDYNGTTEVVRFERLQYGVDLLDFITDFDKLTHWSATGVEKTWNGTTNWAPITSVANDATYISVTFTTAPSADPIAGEYFRLTPRDDDLEVQNVAYAFLADVFEVFSDGDPGDIYV